MNEARENTMQAIAEYLETLYFEGCPEEWADRPSMHDTRPKGARQYQPQFNRNGLQNIDIPVAGNDSKPTKPTFLTAIKSAFTAIFRRNATI